MNQNPKKGQRLVQNIEKKKKNSSIINQPYCSEPFVLAQFNDGPKQHASHFSLGFPFSQHTSIYI